MRTLPPLIAIALVAAACGGDDDPGDAASPDAPSEDSSLGDTADTDVVDRCGDLLCAASEDCASCPLDCEPCEDPPMTECNDGIDNDGDGLVYWQLDVGCWGSGDGTEASGSREEESGWTTFDLSPDSQVIYVSNDGDDSNDGLSPENAVATSARGAELVRDGFPDFLLFRRGDTWRSSLSEDRRERRFKSGRSVEEPLVVGSYGDVPERPVFEVTQPFMDDDGNGRSFLAFVGLAFHSYRKEPSDPDFNGADGGAIRLVAAESHDILMEDNYLEYGEFVLQNGTDLEVRRNVIYRSYHVGTCATRPDGSRDPNGNREFRPSGIFAGSVDGLLIEGNVFDENGWNPDVPEACATIYNHDMYLSGCDRLRVRRNLVLRASSIGIKMAANSTGASTDILIEENLFAEGEIGLSMGGNDDSDYRFTNAVVRANVFTDIGRSQPTTRTLTWYMGITDNDNTEILDNYFLNQPALGNPHGISLNGGTNRAVSIHDNVFAGMQRRALLVRAETGWDVAVADNSFAQSSEGACLVDYEGPLDVIEFSDNAYRADAPEGEWFCVDDGRMDLDGWNAETDEAATMNTEFASDPGRNLDSYAASLGIGDSLADFAAAARTVSRFNVRPELSASSANEYLREGASP